MELDTIIKKYRIPIEWKMQTYVTFEAKDREEAAELAENIPSTSRPEGFYVERSLRAKREEIEMILPRSIERLGSFMQPYIYQGDVMEVEENGECHLIPVKDMTLDDEARETGTLYMDVYYGRLSADGYLDCTPWVWGTSEEEVLDELEELHGDDEPLFQLIEGGKKG